jgi:hypothetical protein
MNHIFRLSVENYPQKIHKISVNSNIYLNDEIIFLDLNSCHQLFTAKDRMKNQNFTIITVDADIQRHTRYVLSYITENIKSVITMPLGNKHGNATTNTVRATRKLTKVTV